MLTSGLATEPSLAGERWLVWSRLRRRGIVGRRNLSAELLQLRLECLDLRLRSLAGLGFGRAQRFGSLVGLALLVRLVRPGVTLAGMSIDDPQLAVLFD